MFTSQKHGFQKSIPAPKGSDSNGKFPRAVPLALPLLMLLLVMTWPHSAAFCQSQSSQQSQSQSQSQAQPEQKQDSVADAAKKAQKDKPKAKKVFTEDDLSGKSGGVSVVGDANAAPKSNTPGAKPSGDASKAVRDEEYWRGRASQIRELMAATDAAINNLKEEIKKNGATGFDAQTGLKDNVIYVDDRNARLKQLEQRRQDLDKQMDLLEEEGRKSGAQPSWFR
jgi:predicted lipid-binding transport protein (Tim44 family)